MERLFTLIDKYRWCPLLTFFIIPLFLMATIYLVANTPFMVPIIILSCIFFVIFLIYLYKKRRKEMISSVATVPTLFGPLLANVYIKQYDPDLYQLLHQGGSIIVQLSFFFAGFIGLIFYLYSGIYQREKTTNLFCFTFIIGIFSMMIFTGKGFIYNEILPGSGILPPVTLLLISRAIIVINAIGAATWPRNNDNRVKHKK